jgi:hypothetical protein
VSAFAKKSRFASALVVALVIGFGLLRSAQCARVLRGLRHAQVCADSHLHLGFGAHATVLMGPAGPQLPRPTRGYWLRAGGDPGLGLSNPAVAVAFLWPENGQRQHRRTPGPSPDDPDAP